MINLDDFVYTYPNYHVDNIQQILTGKEEFNQLKINATEIVPARGKLFKHQLLIKRFMLEYDRLLVMHQTGTGKTCAAVATAEQFMNGVVGATFDFVHQYIKPEKTYIKKIYFLTSSDTLIEEFKKQLVCKCTLGRYITDKIRQATTERGRKTLLNREIAKYYNLYTYRTFVSSIIKNMSNENIMNTLSGSLFIIDEAHNLRTITSGEPEISEEKPEIEEQNNTNLRVYSEIHRVLHNVVRSKFMLLTATPMIDNVSEIEPILNLILPSDQQLKFPDYTKVTFQQMEPYLRGIISYVRLETGSAIPKYIGSTLEGTYMLNDREYPYTTVVYTSTMSQLQQEAYQKSINVKKSAVHLYEFQASNFVFPDGSYGSEGFNKYTKKNSAYSFELTQPLREAINNNLDNISIFSNKFKSIIELCINEPGCCFCYSNFVYGSGAVLLGLLFEELGIERFMESQSIFRSETRSGVNLRPLCESVSDSLQTRKSRIDKKMRYAIITKDTPLSIRDTIFETFNSYENRNGEYIKIFIGTRMIRTGINLANVIQIHLMEPAWNHSNNYQAISRAIRATSHNYLISDLRNEIESKGGNPENIQININIYQHASVINNVSTIDVLAYALSEQKDIEIKRMERFMKQSAIDCQINYNRNVISTDVDYSPQCDYEECRYQCINEPPTSISHNSYNVLYADDIINSIIGDIKNIFKSIFSLTFNQLYYKLSQIQGNYKERIIEINMTIEKLVFDRIPITNRFGRSSYLSVHNGNIFLLSSFPTFHNSSKLYPLVTYSSNLYGVLNLPLPSYLNIIANEINTDVISVLQNTDPDSETFIPLLESLPHNIIINLVEQAIYNIVTKHIESREESPFDVTIYGNFSKLIFSLHDPVKDIDNKIDQLASRGKGRGRKPKENSKIKIHPIDLKDKTTQIKSDTSKEVVYLHILYNQTFDRVSYNTTKKFTKADGRIRLFKPSEGRWRDVNPAEFIIYNSAIQSTIAINQSLKIENMKEMNISQIYGTLSRNDNKFRIVDLTKEKKVTNSKTQNRGQDCSTWRKHMIVEILYKLNLSPPDLSEQDVAEIEDASIEALKNTLIKYRIPSDLLDTMELPQLRFYYTWFRRGFSVKQVCPILLEYFKNNNLLEII